MKKKIILILLSDPNSISEKIILKTLSFLKKKKHNYLFVGSLFFFKRLAKKTFIIENLKNLNNKKINFYNVGKKNLSLNKYINKITDISIDFLKQKKAVCLINMPLNKKILGNKFNGYTEFLANKLDQTGKENMLLFSEDLSVCPISTHIPLRNVPNSINQNKIWNAINNIIFFYKTIIKKKINIKVCGLNPHAGKDNFDKKNEEKKIIIPVLNKISKKYQNVSGPHSADTIFLKSKNSAILGMYHDQVLTTFKTVTNFKAINITIGLKYLRISPNHGTGLDIINNEKKINNESFKFCIKFCEKYVNV